MDTYKLSYDGDKIDETLQLTNDSTKGNRALKAQLDANIDKLTNLSSTVENQDSQIKGIDNTLSQVSSTVENQDGEIETIDSALADEVQERAKQDNNLQSNIDKKQDKLTAGDGITIENNVISSTGGGSSGGKAYKHFITFQYNYGYSYVSGNATLNFVIIDTQSTTYTSSTFDPERIVFGTQRMKKTVGTGGSTYMVNSDFIPWASNASSTQIKLEVFPILDSTGTYYNASPTEVTITRANILNFVDECRLLN